MATDSPDLLAEATRFCEAQLGERSARVFRSRELARHMQAHLERGFRLRDAILAEVHRAARRDGRIADEFVAYFLKDMLRIGSGALRAGLRRYLDTGDLVQSVLGDLWSELAEIRFESRARFLSLLGRRLRWKAVEHVRRLESAGRREDLRAEASPEEIDVPHAGAGPATRLVEGEEEELLILVLHRLGERDARLLRMRLKGSSTDEIASHLGLSREAAEGSPYAGFG